MLGKTSLGFMLALTVGLTGCALFQPAGVANKSGTTIKVGMLASFTGTSAGSGNGTYNGMRMAVKRINDAGGVLGKTIEIERADDKSDVAAAVGAANDLIAKGVVAIVGANSSSAAKAAIEGATKAANIALISPSATSPLFSDPKQLDDGGTFFRTVPSDALQGKVMATKADQLGYKKLAIIYIDNPYGQGFNETLKAAFEAKAGHSVVASVSYKETDTPLQSYATEVGKALAAGPDAVMLIAYAGEASVMINDWLSSKTQSALPWLFCDALNDPAFVANVRDSGKLEGRIGSAPYSNPDFHKQYQALYGEDASYEADAAFDATMLVALAIAEGKQATRASILAHLRSVSVSDGLKVGPDDYAKGIAALATGGKVNYDGYAGPEDFDAQGDVLTGKYQIWTIKGGKVEASSEVITP